LPRKRPSIGPSCPFPTRLSELDARNVKPPPFFQVKAPADAPNGLIVLIDDMGFGQSSAFGGPVHMPTVDSLANQGLRFNESHTTALCSPARAALLTGRNHHMNNMGSITETATAFQGNTGVRPDSVAPLAEMLRLNGYATAAFGKCMRHRCGSSVSRARQIAGRHAPASTSSMASSAAKPINGPRPYGTE
jgi:Sulfatase